MKINSEGIGFGSVKEFLEKFTKEEISELKTNIKFIECKNKWFIHKGFGTLTEELKKNLDMKENHLDFLIQKEVKRTLNAEIELRQIKESLLKRKDLSLEDSLLEDRNLGLTPNQLAEKYGLKLIEVKYILRNK